MARGAACAVLALGCAKSMPGYGTGATDSAGPVAGSIAPGPPPPPPPPIACFARGTPIATPTGDVPIEQLRIGDRVQAYSFEEQRVVSRIVTNTIAHDARAVLSLESSAGPTLRVTPDHPVYVVDSARFEPAANVPTGARLLTLTAIDAVAAIPAEVHADPEFEIATVYDLTVDDLHNYFAAGVLVHNKSRCWPSSNGCNVCVDSPNPYGSACNTPPPPEVAPSVPPFGPVPDAGAADDPSDADASM